MKMMFDVFDLINSSGWLIQLLRTVFGCLVRIGRQRRLPQQQQQQQQQQTLFTTIN